MPAIIEKNVLKQNVEFMHIRSHFSPEYFQFIKKLVGANHHLMPPNVSMENSVSLYTCGNYELLLFIWIMQVKKSNSL